MTYALEIKDSFALDSVVNVASVTHLSPFRYPGGKTWFVPRVRQWLSSIDKPKIFIEPFAGGGIVGLTVAFERLADRVLLIERDVDVAAVWKAILGTQCQKVIQCIESFPISVDAVQRLLRTRAKTIGDRAFQTIVKNRAHRGGILAPGASLMKNGENGKGVGSRWYPKTLAKRIQDIHDNRDVIGFVQGDAFDVIEQYAKARNAVFFIDPPYTVAARRLYRHADIDHARLFEIIAEIKGDFLMTYDNAEPVKKLAASFGFDTAEVSMKNTHHAVMTELLIGRDLTWIRR